MIGSSSGQPVAICTTPGATPCDPTTYQSWCKGNVAVTCVAGYTFEQDCKNGECKADPNATCFGDGT
jgi:hypothetical protein